MTPPPSSYLHKFLRLAEGSEIPPRFALWCGVSSIGAALGRSVYLDKGTYILFPNFCIALIASSGQFRKSTSINLSRSILERSGLLINQISQKITPEALFHAMGKTAKTLGWCEGYVMAQELRNFVNPRAIDSGLDTVLCQMLDCDKNVDYETINRGKLAISNACLNVLAASTAASARSALTTQAVEGGLASRMLFIYENKLPPGVYMGKLSGQKNALKEELGEELREIGELRGEFTMVPEAFTWGKENYLHNRKHHPFSGNDLLEGYLSRRDDHIARLAMILSSSEDKSLTILQRHMEGAEGMLLDIERSLPVVIRLVTSTVSGIVIQQVLESVQSAPSGYIDFPQLAKVYSHKVGYAVFQDALLMLQLSHQIEVSDNGTTRIVKAL